MSSCSARCRASKRGWITPCRHNFPLNLPTNRRLCRTVGGRIVEGWAAHCCAVSAARSRAATITNLARSSLALVLHALFGAAKSFALVNYFWGGLHRQAGPTAVADAADGGASDSFAVCRRRIASRSLVVA